NVQAVSNLEPRANLLEEDMIVKHPRLTAHLKRVYAIPITSDVVSMYERKFVWNRDEVPERIFEDMDGFVVGVVDVTFHRDSQGSMAFAEYVYMSIPRNLYYYEPEKRFGIIATVMENPMHFNKDETYEISLYTFYSKDYAF